MCFSGSASYINKLRSLCVGIERAWEEHLEFWEDEEPGEYDDVSIIVHHVIDGFASGKTQNFETIFKITEQAVKSDNKLVSEVAVIGFIEGLLMVGSHEGMYSEFFKNWLGPESFKAFEELEHFFNGLT